MQCFFLVFNPGIYIISIVRANMQSVHFRDQMNCDQKIYLVGPSHMLIVNSNNFWPISIYFSQFYPIFCRHLFFQFQKIWTINYHWFIAILFCYYNFFIYKWICAKLLHVFVTQNWWIILAHSILHIYSYVSSMADYNLWNNYLKWKVHFFHWFFLLISVLLKPKVFNIVDRVLSSSLDILWN